MSDIQQTQDTIVSAPVSAADSASVEAATTSSVSTEIPVTESAPENALVETAEAPASEGPVESVLGDTSSKEVKPADGAKPDAIKEEVKPSGDADSVVKPEAESPVAPVYEEFKLPENYSADKGSLDGFTKLLGELETASGKMDHAGYQEAGQKLVDLGTKAVQDSINRLNDYYAQIHETQKKDWFESFKKDPDMGGEKLAETVSVLRGAVESYGGTEAQVAEFRQVMKDTGVGNHPAITRILYNMAQKISKYETEADNGNGGSNRIVPGARPAPSKTKDYQRFYGGQS